MGRKPECEVATLGTHGSPDPDGSDALKWPHCDGLNWPHLASDRRLTARVNELEREAPEGMRSRVEQFEQIRRIVIVRPSRRGLRTRIGCIGGR